VIRVRVLKENIMLMTNGNIFVLNPPNATLCRARYWNSLKTARVGTSAWFGGCRFAVQGLLAPSKYL